MTYQQLGEALNNLKVETDMQSAQVIYTHDNVRLYFISNEGVVSSSSEPSVLRILQLEDGTGKEPLFYLQVGDWFYPLVPNVSPCFRSEYGAFILPDVHGEDGSAVGIMLPPDADKSVYNLLEDILHCIVTTEPIAPPRHRVKRDETRSAAVSRSIVSDKHRHKKRSHRDPEDAEKKSHRRHRRHHRRHHDDEDAVDDGESVTSSSKDSHRRHRGKKHHGYDLLPKSRHSKHLYGVPVFGNYRTVLGVKPSEMVVAEEEKPQKLLVEKRVEKEMEKKEKEVEKKEKGEKEEEEEEDSDESSSTEGSSDSEDTVEEAEEVALDPKEEKRRRKEEYKEEKRRRKEEYKRSNSKSSSSSGGQGKRRGKRFVLASKYRAPGAQYISSGLVRGAEKASEYINSSTPRLLEKITPDPTPRQVSPGLAKGAEVARNVTGTAVVVTGYVANKVGSATMALGRYLAPHIQKGGTRLAGVAGVDEATAAARVEGAMTLAAGAVEGFSTVYTGLEQAGSILGNSLTNNTVHIVEHKYGQPMGQVTGHTLHSIGNAYAASQNFRIFTPKNLAKKTAKDAGKAFVEDFRAELRNHNSMPQQNHNSLMQQQNHNSLMQQQNYNSMPPQHQMNGDQKPPLDKPGPSKS
ncbi:protein spartin isoform X2 [Nilaparvata lugens]|uniref:protein spartin isoform X2 n=1 Tax=Nilaparvata lugens TaxID=108931 RepID=UPI00193DD11E|nr:protein spartin isoform X2 [Nilaparvata lugens]